MKRRLFIVAILAAGLAVPAGAHHGWSWTTGGNIELTGTITEARLGNPHGILTVDTDGDVWTVEAGQPWRHERAGLDEARLAPGTEITVIGEPAADLSRKVVKAERIVLDGVTYDLYPNRS